MRFTKKELFENHSRLMERDELYCHMGYDDGEGVGYVVSKAIPLNGRILEIGTGKGRFLVELLKKLPFVTTVDVDSTEQRFARMNVAYQKPGGRARFVVADAGCLPWRNATYDAVVSMNALHHISHLPRVLEEIQRVVRLNGKVVLADFNRRGFSLLDKIHSREGRTHDRLKYSFKAVATHFLERHWRVALFNGDFQDVLVARKFDS